MAPVCVITLLQAPCLALCRLHRCCPLCWPCRCDRVGTLCQNSAKSKWTREYLLSTFGTVKNDAEKSNWGNHFMFHRGAGVRGGGAVLPRPPPRLPSCLPRTVHGAYATACMSGRGFLPDVGGGMRRSYSTMPRPCCCGCLLGVPCRAVPLSREQGADFQKPTESVRMTYQEWVTALDLHEADPEKNPHVYFKASNSDKNVGAGCGVAKAPYGRRGV